MTDEPELQPFLAVKSWRVGFDGRENMIGVEFVDMDGKLHSFALLPRAAELLSERIAIRVNQLQQMRSD